MKKIYGFLFGLLLVLLIGCTNDTTQSSKTQKENINSIVQQEKSEKVVVYLSGPEEMLNKLESEFENERGDVTDFLKMSCGQVRSKVWTEKEAGQIQADVIWGSDPLIYNMLDDEELLSPYTVKETDFIKPKFLIKGRDYILVNERYVVMMYNKDKFGESELPKSFADLTNNKYKNMLVMADPNQSSTALGITSSLYQMMGNKIDYFIKLNNNGTKLTKSNGLVPSKILEGEFELGIGPSDSVVRLKNKAKKEGYEMPVEIIWPEEGAIAIQRPIAIVKNEMRSDNKQKVAEELVDFMVSKKAQIITTKFGFASVRKDIENNYLPENINIYEIDWSKASKNEQNVKKQYQEIFQK